MYTKALYCGNCGHFVDFSFREVIDYRHLTPEELKRIKTPNTKKRQIGPTGSIVRQVNNSDTVNAAGVSNCPRCNFPSLIIFETARRSLDQLLRPETTHHSIRVDIPVLTVLQQYPPVAEPDLDPNWPDSIVRKFSDAQRMQMQEFSPSIVLTTCGTVLELALKELDPEDTGSKLFNRIEKLHDAGVITSPIRDWAHDLRLERNEAVHEGEGDALAAAEYIEFLKMFFNMAFSLPKRIAEKRAKTSL